jgi:hypothetical protein
MATVTVDIMQGGSIDTLNNSPVHLALGPGAPPGAALSGPMPGPVVVNAVNGVATFVGLSINVPGHGYSLVASDAGPPVTTNGQSNSFNVLGAPAQLLFTSQPNSVVAGQPLGTVTVQIEDALGDVETIDNSSTVALGLGPSAPPTAVLNGAMPMTVNHGVATFTNLSIDQAAMGYTLLATDTSAIPSVQGPSNSFDISPGSPSQLAFFVQPANNANTGQSLGQVEVHVEDAYGNLVSADSMTLIDVALAPNATGGTLNGTTRQTDMSGGIAVFNNLSISRPGTYQLTATAAGLGSTNSMNAMIGTPTEPANANNAFGPTDPVVSDNGTIAETLTSPSTADFFRVNITGPGDEQLTALVSALTSTNAPAPVTLTLLNSSGALVIQSAGSSPTDLDAEFVQILTPGTWYLEVTSPTAGVTFTLATTGVAALPTSQPLAPVTNPGNLITGDFNNDGIADLATVSTSNGQGSVEVYLGLGDGAFQPPAPIPVTGTPIAVAAGDFNGDGNIDLAVLCSEVSGDDQVTLLMNEGGATFVPAPGSYDTGTTGGVALVVADFDGKNGPDVAVASASSDPISVLLNNGDRTLSAPIFTTGTAAAPLASLTDLVAGDFNGDHTMDLAVTTLDQKGAVAILLGNGDGTFTVQPTEYHVGNPAALGGMSFPMAIVSADFNGDGTLDLATANNASGDLSILYGNGNGTFQAAVNDAVGTSPIALVAANITGGAHPDLVVADQVSNDAAILQNHGSSFTLEQTAALGGAPVGLAAADFTGDGRIDFASVNRLTGDLTVQIQNVDGSFTSPALRVGGTPMTLVAADLNNDKSLDIVTLNQATDNLSVLLGDGEGSFSIANTITVTGTPIAVASGDFNGDGRTDLAILSYQVESTGSHFLVSTLTILLGYGDGTFQTAQVMTLPNHSGSAEYAAALAVGDFNHDGHEDIAVVYQLETPATGMHSAGKHVTQGTYVQILNGQGGGTFQIAATYQLSATDPLSSYKIAAGDLNDDGSLDLVVLNESLGTVTVLLNASGTFSVKSVTSVGTGSTDLLIADLNGAKYANNDPILDIAVLTPGTSSQVMLLPGNGDGTFGTGQVTPLTFGSASDPLTFAAGDFAGNGNLDLAIADYDADKLYILDNSGTGTFTAEATYYSTGDGPLAPVVGDFNNDNYNDIALVDSEIGDVAVFLNQRGGGFAPSGQAAVSQPATPLYGDVNGDRIPDVVIRASNGAILFRPGIPGQPGTFGSAMLVNGNPKNPAQLMAARAVALITTASGTSIAAVNDVGDVLVTYTWQPGNSFSVQAGPMVGPLVTAIGAADLNGDGRTDLVVTNSTNVAEILLQQLDGSFVVAATVSVGFLPSSVTFINNASGGPDIAVTGAISGDVTIIRNDSGKFDIVERYRAGQGPYDLNQTPQGGGMVESPEATAGVIAGSFGSGTGSDLITINPGTSSLDLLSGTSSGKYDNPQLLANIVSDPIAIAGGTLTTQHGSTPFFAVLSAATDAIYIFVSNGSGGFTEMLSPNVNGALAALDAGKYPTGLSIADANADDNYDLLVGNSYGDVLVLYGNGDGTFQTAQSTGRNTALAAADLTGSGSDAIVVSNQSASTVELQGAPGGVSFNQGRSNGVEAPGAVQFADVNGDGITDMVVVNSGGDDVLVYLGLGGGQFGAAQTFAVGDNPVGLTLYDVSGDGLPDLIVANEGSNDVSVLLSSGRGASWTLTSGPRLHAGLGPVATAVADVNGDGIPDLLVSNSLKDTLSVLPGVGGGFFKDAVGSVTFNTGSTPGQVLVGHFDSQGGIDVAVLNTGSSTLTYFSNFSTSSGAGSGTQVSTGGTTPVAATVIANSTGLSDLLIVNDGSDTITMLTAGSTGPEVSETFTTTALVSPTDVALSTDGTEFFVTEEGSDEVFTFSLDASGVAVVSVPSAEPTETTTELVSVDNSPLDTVAVLVNAPALSVSTGPNPDLLPRQSAANTSLPFAVDQAEAGVDVLAIVVVGEESGDSGATGGSGSGDVDTKPLTDDTIVPVQDGPELLRFLQNLDTLQPGDAAGERPDPPGNSDPGFDPMNDRITQPLLPWPAGNDTMLATAEPPAPVLITLTAPTPVEPTAVFITPAPTQPAIPHAIEQPHVEAPTVPAERIETPAVEQAASPSECNEKPALLAAPLVAAYFAREWSTQRERVGSKCWWWAVRNRASGLA